MAKQPNGADSVQFQITVSVQSGRVLDRLVTRGIYGRNRAEVAARFVDERLRAFVTEPTLRLPLRDGK